MIKPKLLRNIISDILFTIGGKDNLELSCKYYCKAAELNPGNVRALFGIQLASSTLSSIGMWFNLF